MIIQHVRISVVTNIEAHGVGELGEPPVLFGGDEQLLAGWRPRPGRAAAAFSLLGRRLIMRVLVHAVTPPGSA